MDLLTSSEKTTITGGLMDLFDSQKRTILIHKEPIKVISNVYSNSDLYGYGEQSNVENYTYTPVSGYFEAVVRYKKEQGFETFQETKVDFPHGVCRIKVLESGRNFIKSGITESIEIDGNKFNVVSDDGVKNHFDLIKYYYFILERTN